jgi:hypothetical protein
MTCGIFEKRDYDDFEHCQYDGSITVADAIQLLKTPGTHFSGSDWKYGWPHKFYIDAPNPKADEIVEVGGESGPHVDGTHPDDRWTCFAHRHDCTCPRERPTGYWHRVRFGTKPQVHLKFYATHLGASPAAERAEFSRLSERVFGIAWDFGDDLKLRWRAIPNTQKWGVIGTDGQPDHSEMRQS